MKKVFVHLGYPKTGTTFLQKNLFPFHRDINYLGNKSYNEDIVFPIDLKILLNYYFKLNRGFLASNDQISQFNREIYKFENSIKETKANLISNEGFLSPLSYFSNGFIDFFKFLNVKLKTKVKFFFIITTRNHDDLLFSFYCFNINRIIKSYPKLTSYDSFIKFLEFSKLENNPATKHFFNCFDDKRIITDINKNFGAGSVLNLKYEEFSNSNIKKRYFEKMSAFLDIDFTITEKLVKVRDFENYNYQKHLDIAYLPKKHELSIRSKTFLRIKKIIPKFIIIFLKKIFYSKEINKPILKKKILSLFN